MACNAPARRNCQAGFVLPYHPTTLSLRRISSGTPAELVVSPSTTCCWSIAAALKGAFRTPPKTGHFLPTAICSSVLRASAVVANVQNFLRVARKCQKSKIVSFF
jgi:hypothetical protein